MIQISKKIFQELIRFLVCCTSRKLRNKIYSFFPIGHYLHDALKSISCAILYTDNFQWFKFKSGPRAGLEIKLKLPEENEFYLETHDPDVTALLCKYIKPGFTVVDVGAHIGYFTLLISRLVGPEGKIFALEPSPRNARRLEEHLFRNHCSQNTKILELALTECDGEEGFLDFNTSTIGRLSSIEPQSYIREKSTGYIIVVCRSLDSLLQNYNIKSLDFVKIDVEGAELRVLQGMENLLKIYKPKLLIEMHNEKIVKEIVEFLENRRYRTYINEKMLNKSMFSQVTLGGLNVFFIVKNNKWLI